MKTKSHYLIISLGFASFLSIFTNTRTNFLQGASLDQNPELFYFLLTNMIVMALYFIYEGYASFKAMQRGQACKSYQKLKVGFMLSSIVLILFELVHIYLLQNSISSCTFIIGKAIVVGLYLCFGYLIWLHLLYDAEKIYLALSALLWGTFASCIALIPFEILQHAALICASLVSLLLFIKSSYKAPQGFTEHSFTIQTGDEGLLFNKLLSVIMRPIIFISITGFVSGALRVLIEGNYSFNFRVLIFFVTAALGMGIFLVALYNNNRFNYHTNYLKVSIVVACSMFVLPFLHHSLLPILLGIVDTLYFLSLILMWAMSIEVAKSNQWDLKFVAGIFIGLVHVIVTAGFIVSSTLVVYELDQQEVYFIVSLVSVFFILLVIVYLMLNSQDSQAVLYEFAIEEVEQEQAISPAQLNNELKPEVDRQVLISTYSEKSLRENKKLTEVYGLTEREMDILILALTGRNAQGIADILYISQNTVKTHLKNIYKKFDVHSHKELLEFIELIQK